MSWGDIAPAETTALVDVRSADYRAVEEEAKAKWDAGLRAEAKAMLYGESTDAAPPDAAAARLRLAYMNFSDQNESEARRLLALTADMPAGVNDAARAEAAVRLGHLALRDRDYDLARARFQRLLSGEYAITHADSVAVARRLGLLEQHEKRLQDAIPFPGRLRDVVPRRRGLPGHMGLRPFRIQ